MWEKTNPGPMARDALAAIGLPSEVDRIVIEIRDSSITVNGAPASSADASLVYNASRCDPHDFAEELHENLVSHMRRAIIIRRMLNVIEGGPDHA